MFRVIELIRETAPRRRDAPDPRPGGRLILTHLGRPWNRREEESFGHARPHTEISSGSWRRTLSRSLLASYGNRSRAPCSRTAVLRASAWLGALFLPCYLAARRRRRERSAIVGFILEAEAAYQSRRGEV